MPAVVPLGWVGTWWQSRLIWKRDQNKELNAVANAEATQNHELVAQLQAERIEGFPSCANPACGPPGTCPRSKSCVPQRRREPLSQRIPAECLQLIPRSQRSFHPSDPRQGC